MAIENLRKKLIFRSHHRGTKEMDLILGSFADRYVMDFSESELAEYARILEYPDPDLYDWITGKTPAPANDHNTILKKLLKYQLHTIFID